MSPVNEEPIVEEEDPRFANVRAIASRGVMGASDRMPARVIVLLLLTGLTVSLAPIPANIVGIITLLLLTIDIAIHRR
jgi:hypothetical protein